MTKLEEKFDKIENTLGYYRQEVSEFTKLLDDIKCNYNIDIFELYIYRLEGDIEMASIMVSHYEKAIEKFMLEHPEFGEWI